MRIYIDTSVINGLYAEDVIWIKQITKNFFKSAKNRYKLYISDIVADEIKRTPDVSKRRKLLDIVKRYGCIELIRTQEAEKLANKYIVRKIIPHKYRADALHIAIASVHRIPVLVSWNFKHIVRLKTRIGINYINKKYGYIQMNICSPEEV
jgi:predicted nucleic acid-binding protein